MYLSCLLINVGDNPDRPRPGRLWLRNLYRVHQRLCMAFPSTERKTKDCDFLAPFIPKEFADVHTRRSPEQGFLFRVDPLPGNRAVILVQSAREPDWDYAFKNANFLLAGPAQTKPFEPQYSARQRLRFRLLANPVRKIRLKDRDDNLLTEHMSKGPNNEPLNAQWHGKKVPVPHEDLKKWLERRAEPAWVAPKNSKDQHPPGFKIEEIVNVQPGYVYVNKGRDHTAADANGKNSSSETEKKTSRRICSALFEGVLEVTNTDIFRQTLASGIGSGKAFGFGLLSVARA
jgi:CRISPR system Cascade subunit CasE